MDKTVFETGSYYHDDRPVMRLVVPPSLSTPPSVLEVLDSIEDPLQRHRFFNENKAAIVHAFSQLRPEKDLVVETKVF